MDENTEVQPTTQEIEFQLLGIREISSEQNVLACGLRHGYTRITTGMGEWNSLGFNKVQYEVAMYNDGSQRVVTISVEKQDLGDGSLRFSINRAFTFEEYQQRVAEFNITHYRQMPITDYLKELEKKEKQRQKYCI